MVSGLVNYKLISPFKTSPRNHPIDTITIHCFVGQVTARRGCEVFQTNGASCNYVVGYDGSIGLVADEADRSYCSSNPENDHRAVTIEVASDNFHPYAVTPRAYDALLNLVTDICKRNGIERLVWSKKKTDRVNHANGCNMTVHRDFANKACPGEYLYSRHGEIAKEVNRRLQEMEYSEWKKFMDRWQNEQAKKPADKWAQAGVEIARASGITDGERPQSATTRQETALMCKATLEAAVDRFKNALAEAMKG